MEIGETSAFTYYIKITNENKIKREE